MMKISDDTRDVLKNFSTINSGIRVKTGNKLETISNMKNILAVATVSEEFPTNFSIYNLPEFLGATSLLEDPDFNFGETSLSIADNNSKLAYFYASEGMVIAPDKMITMPDAEIEFKVTSTLLRQCWVRYALPAVRGVYNRLGPPSRASLVCSSKYPSEWP